PLRERPDDIGPLVEHLAREDHALFGTELMREIAARPWLGNVRELRNFVERARALGPGEALAMSASDAPPPAAGDAPEIDPSLPYRDVREAWIEHVEKTYVAKLLARHERNVGEAARAAGLDRAYLYKLIKRHGL